MALREVGIGMHEHDVFMVVMVIEKYREIGDQFSLKDAALIISAKDGLYPEKINEPNGTS